MTEKSNDTMDSVNIFAEPNHLTGAAEAASALLAKKKTRKVKADYAVLEDTGEGTFKLVSTAKSLKAAKARLVSEKLSGEFLLVTLRGRVKATVVEQLKLKAV